MTENRAPEPDADLEWNPEIDPSDARVAWNFGTRELTDEEYEQFADYTRRDLERVYAAREADEAWAREQADLRAAAQAEAEAHQAEPEPEAEIG